MPTEFKVLNNATAYFVNATSTMPPNSVVLNYTVFFNQSGISPLSLIILLQLRNLLYPTGILSFDNGDITKVYVPSSLPEGYSVDDNGIASFEESILFPGNILQAFYRDGQTSLQMNLVSLVGNTTSVSDLERIDTPVFISIIQQEQGIIICY